MKRPRSSTRWRRWSRRAGFLFAFLFVGVTVIILVIGWWAPAAYLPSAGVRVVGTKLDGSGHDARYALASDDGYILDIRTQGAASSGGALLYFGALHSKDPQHPQLTTLRRVWKEFRPTVALLEGRMSFFVGTTDQGIRQFGEPAAVHALAEDAGIPLYTLEPPLEIEIAALEECGDRKQVAIFRVLSGYISARRGGPVSDFKIRRLLSKRAAPLTDALPTIEAFDVYFASQFPQLGAWRDMPERAMWPSEGGTLLNRMARRGNEVRDEHFNRVVIDLVRRGERVLAVAGRSHTIIQEPILWESLQPADRGELSSPRPWEQAEPVAQP